VTALKPNRRYRFTALGRNFNFSPADQACGLHRGSCRFGIRDERLVDLVHLRHIVKTGNETVTETRPVILKPASSTTFLIGVGRLLGDIEARSPQASLRHVQASQVPDWNLAGACFEAGSAQNR
jgi:hypothetical protein